MSESLKFWENAWTGGLQVSRNENVSEVYLKHKTIFSYLVDKSMTFTTFFKELIGLVGLFSNFFFHKGSLKKETTYFEGEGSLTIVIVRL